ncbi:MAG: hypothetical protein ACPGJV_02715 [Bacteriovoracaceae bacterium]
MIKTIKAKSKSLLMAKIEELKETHTVKIIKKHGQTEVVNENTKETAPTKLGKEGLFEHGWNICAVVEVEDLKTKKTKKVEA